MEGVRVTAIGRSLLLALAICECAAGATAPASRAQTGAIFVRAARWLDPMSGLLNGPVVVQIVDGRIAMIAAAGTTPVTSAPVRDLGEVTLLPGLIDAHVHLGI